MSKVVISFVLFVYYVIVLLLCFLYDFIAFMLQISISGNL